MEEGYKTKKMRRKVKPGVERSMFFEAKDVVSVWAQRWWSTEGHENHNYSILFRGVCVGEGGGL